MAQAPNTSDEKFRTSMEDWFVDRGVPYFCPQYKSRSRFDDVAVFLFMMLAVEVGVAWFELSALGLIAVLTTVVYVVLLAPVAGPREWLESPRARQHFVPGVLLLGAVGVILSVAAGFPIGRWIDAAIVFIGLYAAFELADSNVWTGREAELTRRRAQVVSLTVLGVILFALEGSVFKPPLDQALLALLVVAVILHLARSLASSPGSSAGGLPDPEPAFFGAMAPVMPLLVILLGAETALLPHVADSVVVQTTAPLVLTALLALASVLAFVRARRIEPMVVPNAERVRELGRRVPENTHARATARVALWVLPFLVTYPLLVGLLFELDAFGARLHGVGAAAAALAINVAFVGVAWLMVAFGIDAFARTVRAQAKAIVESIVMALANGLPLLIVFTVFFALTAETWEVAAEATMGAYFGLLGALFAFTLIFIVATAVIELRRESRFESWHGVKDAALRANGSEWTNPPDRPFADRLNAMPDATVAGEEAACLSLRGKSRLNAISVLTAYQLIVFFPVTIAAALLFWGLGKLAVPPDVAAQWIGGDNVSDRVAHDITSGPITEEPWLRVGALLGAFSSLYLAVHLQSSEGQRKQFFDATERGVKQLLAVKVVYDRHRELAGDRSPGRPAPHCQR